MTLVPREEVRAKDTIRGVIKIEGMVKSIEPEIV